MPSPHKLHQVNEHLHYLAHSDYNRHFLPSLCSQNHHSSHPPQQQQPQQLQQRQQQQQQQRQETSPVRQTRRLGSPSVPSNSRLTMVNSDDLDRKLDRKSMARRQLMENLYPVPGLRQAGRGVHRSCSFNHTSYSLASQRQKGKAGSYLQLRENRPEMRHGRPRWTRQSAILQSISVEKAKEALENWNHLVLELHSEQFRQQSESHNHLAVLSDNVSETSLTYTNGDTRTGEKGSSLTKTKSKYKTISVATGQFPTGLGFTKYRPITPNLLNNLDKQKLPSRKRTQLWINQLPDQRRSYSSGPQVESSAGEGASSSGVSKEILSRPVHRVSGMS